MLMADTMAIFLSVLGFMLALPALWLLCWGLWPEAGFRASQKTDRNIVRPFAVGLPITAAALIIAAATRNLFGSAGVVGAGAVICLYVIYAGTGIAGLATTIGGRLKSPADRERPWKATLRGSIVLELTYLLPVLGWFVILPASLIIGTGAVTLSLLNSKPAQAVVISSASEQRTETGSAVPAGLP